MAKYSKGAQKKVKRAMHEKKKGTLKSGRSGRKVKSRKQAIAIGLSEARKAGAKVPKKKGTAKKKTAKKKTARKKTAGKKTARKSAPKKRTAGRGRSTGKKKSAGRKRSSRKS
jgi:hypothetical protein